MEDKQVVPLEIPINQVPGSDIPSDQRRIHRHWKPTPAKENPKEIPALRMAVVLAPVRQKDHQEPFLLRLYE